MKSQPSSDKLKLINMTPLKVSHAEPWANPRAPLKALKWMGREDSPLLWRMRADPAQWGWGLRFLRECTASRARANVGAIVRLGLASRAALQALRRELALEYDHLERGILHFYTDPREFEHALPQAALMRGAHHVLNLLVPYLEQGQRTHLMGLVDAYNRGD